MVKKISKPRFIKNKNNTITDTLTGLIWGPTFEKVMNWNDAEKACKELKLAGHKDWRLPTVKELISLVDYTKYIPAIDTKFFPDTKSNWYWTSTIHAGDPGHAWIVSFSNGDVNVYYKDYGSHIRPVRSSK